MENNKKQQNGSSSSLTSQLFGPPETDVLASIFPPSKGRNSACNDARGSWQNEPSGSGNQPLINKQGITDNKDRNSIYHQEGAEPSYLSSSLHYGGQETYSRSTTHQSPCPYPKYKKDDGGDDPSGAARGNWWQGSLYY
ncbi:hypothetical protein RND81_05G262600 [Saponaria officinalis]|uniref:Uncharacterized protein n=1 Tax=Saponaria officinalis TaxID=3572 RepID=A0AAW1L123_SAPOF